MVPEAPAWLRETCRSLDIRIVGPIEAVHVRPWSTVFRAPTDSDAVYLKCCGPTQRHEPRLTALLSREFPDAVTKLLALHPDRPWILVAEGGKKLRDVFAGDALLSAWREILPRYARLQQAITSRTEEILALGTPDHRGAALVASFERVVAGEPALSGERADRLTPDETRALVTLIPRLEADLRALHALGIEDTLQHDDLHHNNVLVRDGRMVIFDWGDSCVSHPFLTLAVTLRFAAQATGRTEGAPAISALRDAYLEPWSDRTSPGQLREAAVLGRRVGEVSRALTFDAVARAYPRVIDTNPGGLAGSLRRVLALFG